MAYLPEQNGKILGTLLQAIAPYYKEVTLLSIRYNGMQIAVARDARVCLGKIALCQIRARSGFTVCLLLADVRPFQNTRDVAVKSEEKP
jgi:hypothetical protein